MIDPSDTTPGSNGSYGKALANSFINPQRQQQPVKSKESYIDAKVRKEFEREGRREYKHPAEREIKQPAGTVGKPSRAKPSKKDVHARMAYLRALKFLKKKALSNKPVLRKERVVYTAQRYQPVNYNSIFFNALMLDEAAETNSFLFGDAIRNRSPFWRF